MQIEIPNKSSFKQEEVCELTGVKPYILRFWESEFDQICPLTSSSGQKIYEHKDIVNIAKIKELLVGQKISIEKAKKSLTQGKRPGRASKKTSIPSPAGQELILAKEKLQNIISQTQTMQNLLNGAQ